MLHDLGLFDLVAPCFFDLADPVFKVSKPLPFRIRRVFHNHANPIFAEFTEVFDESTIKMISDETYLATLFPEIDRLLKFDLNGVKKTKTATVVEIIEIDEEIGKEQQDDVEDEEMIDSNNLEDVDDGVSVHSIDEKDGVVTSNENNSMNKEDYDGNDRQMDECGDENRR